MPESNNSRTQFDSFDSFHFFDFFDSFESFESSDFFDFSLILLISLVIWILAQFAQSGFFDVYEIVGNPGVSNNRGPERSLIVLRVLKWNPDVWISSQKPIIQRSQ